MKTTTQDVHFAPPPQPLKNRKMQNEPNPHTEHQPLSPEAYWYPERMANHVIRGAWNGVHTGSVVLLLGGIGASNPPTEKSKQ
jgi:hypothetical protein